MSPPVSIYTLYRHYICLHVFVCAPRLFIYGEVTLNHVLKSFQAPPVRVQNPIVRNPTCTILCTYFFLYIQPWKKNTGPNPVRGPSLLYIFRHTPGQPVAFCNPPNKPKSNQINNNGNTISFQSISYSRTVSSP